MLGAGVLLLDRVVGLSLPLAVVVAGSVLAWILLVAWRSVYRSWLTLNRRQGRFTQHTVVVGTDRRALELIRLAEVHPETGTRVVGLVGSREEAETAGHGDLWLGELADIDDVLVAAQADRIAVCATELDPAVLATLIGREHEGGPEVVVHPGLSGIDARRVTVSAVANEALLHVEPAAPSAVARGVKRLLDIVVAGTLLLIAAPVFAIVAVLVKREDGGPDLLPPAAGRA